MKLLSVKEARAIWLFPIEDVNPSGKYLYPLLGELVKKYKFAQVPNVAEAVKNNQGIVLGQGAFTFGKRGESWAELGIYNDGLVGATHSHTDASEALLTEILSWASKEYGLQPPKSIRKLYASELYVETNSSLGSLNPQLARFAKALSAKMKIVTRSAYELGGINFAAEQSSPFVPPLFRFERADKMPFSENRYFSASGLPTADHLELLGQLEEILS